MQPEEGFNRNELRRLANMYEMMQQVQRSAELEERQREEAEELPLALPLTGGLLPREKYIEDKRGSCKFSLTVLHHNKVKFESKCFNRPMHPPARYWRSLWGRERA